MDIQIKNTKPRGIGLALIAAMLFAVTAFAYGGGGGHGGGGGSHGGFGGGHSGYASARGFAGHHYGGYGGWHGGYGGWRGGYGGYGGWGLGYGLLWATLPFDYSTYWWGGVPYYYADDNYYTWDADANAYQTVEPPVQVANQVAAQTTSDLFAYPKNGQSAELQARDRKECTGWASEQTGFSASIVNAPPATQENAASPAPTTRPNLPATRQNFMRAEAACLEGRGYSVQ